MTTKLKKNRATIVKRRRRHGSNDDNNNNNHKICRRFETKINNKCSAVEDDRTCTNVNIVKVDEAPGVDGTIENFVDAGRTSEKLLIGRRHSEECTVFSTLARWLPYGSKAVLVYLLICLCTLALLLVVFYGPAVFLSAPSKITAPLFSRILLFSKKKELEPAPGDRRTNLISCPLTRTFYSVIDRFRSFVHRKITRLLSGSRQADQQHNSSSSSSDSNVSDEERAACAKSCRIEIVESLPEKLDFTQSETDLTGFTLQSTHDAWKELLNLTRRELKIAAYKSSLRGKHVTDSADFNPSTALGEDIFQRLVQLKDRLKDNLSIKMVENFPPKDKGDNEDGISLERRGIIKRKALHFKQMFPNSGPMHSKFLLVDQRHFYLGSANFDWRSLNQKLELGVLVKNCPCLAKDLASIFDRYWQLGVVLPAGGLENKVLYNLHNPLKLHDDTHVYLGASPPFLNEPNRTWDLEGILYAINKAEKFIYINVMDFSPMFLYRAKKKYWPVIDDALRRAVVERDVELKLISAALHYVPQNLFLLKSLQILNELSSRKSRVQIKIFRVTSSEPFHASIARDRRTHRKFMVTEDHVIIGTSNWSGDYFEGSTGVQIFIRQQQQHQKYRNHQNNDTSNSDDEKSTTTPAGHLVQRARLLFLRDWHSAYAHDLDFYMRVCVGGGDVAHDAEHWTMAARVCEPARRQ